MANYIFKFNIPVRENAPFYKKIKILQCTLASRTVVTYSGNYQALHRVCTINWSVFTEFCTPTLCDPSFWLKYISKYTSSRWTAQWNTSTAYTRLNSEVTMVMNTFQAKLSILTLEVVKSHVNHNHLELVYVQGAKCQDTFWEWYWTFQIVWRQLTPTALASIQAKAKT